MHKSERNLGQIKLTGSLQQIAGNRLRKRERDPRHAKEANRMAGTNKTKMLNGALYDALDPQLTAERLAAEASLLRLNCAVDPSERELLLHALLGGCGAGTVVRSPFHCDYGYNITMGAGVFLNFGCVLLDVMPIVIGDGTQIGPGVQVYAADHPRDAETRRRGLELGRPVWIGQDVWIGGGAILLPGVTVGDGAVIGAGSVVTHDVEAGSTVAGNPARRLHKA